jgi:hypothetical protein
MRDSRVAIRTVGDVTAVTPSQESASPWTTDGAMR